MVFSSETTYTSNHSMPLSFTSLIWVTTACVTLFYLVGVTFQDDIEWSNHICLFRAKKYHSSINLQTSYICQVKLSLDYCSQINGKHPTATNLLESIQFSVKLPSLGHRRAFADQFNLLQIFSTPAPTNHQTNSILVQQLLLFLCGKNMYGLHS